MRVFLFVLLWFCFDDWLARVTGAPWVGVMPFWVWTLALLITIPRDGKSFDLTIRKAGDSKPGNDTPRRMH